MTDTTAEVRIAADTELPAIRITRDFAATPAQLLRAHTDPELFARWVGPHDLTTQVQHWDARTGGSWRYLSRAADGQEYGFHGCFHQVRPGRLVQTFTFDGFPDAVALDTLTFTELGDGLTRLEAFTMFTSFADRDGMLASDMETGVGQGYAKLDGLLAAGGVADGAA